MSGALTFAQEVRLRELRHRALRAAAVAPARLERALEAAGAWDEGQHARDRAGRFSRTVGGGAGDDGSDIDAFRKDLRRRRREEGLSDDAPGGDFSPSEKAEHSRIRKMEEDHVPSAWNPEAVRARRDREAAEKRRARKREYRRRMDEWRRGRDQAGGRANPRGDEPSERRHSIFHGYPDKHHNDAADDLLQNPDSRIPDNVNHSKLHEALAFAADDEASSPTTQRNATKALRRLERYLDDDED